MASQGNRHCASFIGAHPQCRQRTAIVGPTTPTADDYAQNVKYIRLTAAYLTTVRQVIIKLFYLQTKRVTTTLKCLFFTINCRASRYVYNNNEQLHGCHVCVKISAQLPPKASPI